MQESMWGQAETQYFYELTPDKILDAVEQVTGLRCTGRSLALNSMENRVYEVEVETDAPLKSPSERFRIVKFYRPGRWTAAQIQEEHDYLKDLVAEEVPVIAPLGLAGDGATLHHAKDMNLWFTVFPKGGGRVPDELAPDDLQQVGRLLARMHNVGAMRPFKHRLHLTPEVYGRMNLQFLLEHNLCPAPHRPSLETVGQAFVDACIPLMRDIPSIRIHGDCHAGNLLWTGRPFWVDFDDCVMGPPIQDLWLLVGGRDHEAQQRMRHLVEGYTMMRPLHPRSGAVIEALRGLRLIHFAAWIARRWQDPAFQRNFEYFGSDRYWQELVQDVREQTALLHDSPWNL